MTLTLTPSPSLPHPHPQGCTLFATHRLPPALFAPSPAQVAQYLLEEAAVRHEPISIVCTQPRRISAIGVAERVASERGEVCGDGAVGYAVRGESRQSASTTLLFCTTGVLLRMLEEDPELKGFTHVLVDEVGAERHTPRRHTPALPPHPYPHPSRYTSGRSRVTS